MDRHIILKFQQIGLKKKIRDQASIVGYWAIKLCVSVRIFKVSPSPTQACCITVALRKQDSVRGCIQTRWTQASNQRNKLKSLARPCYLLRHWSLLLKRMIGRHQQVLRFSTIAWSMRSCQNTSPMKRPAQTVTSTSQTKIVKALLLKSVDE